MAWFDTFTTQCFRAGEGTNSVDIFTRFGGNRTKPALLLVHGFPQSHVLWHRVAQQL